MLRSAPLRIALSVVCVASVLPLILIALPSSAALALMGVMVPRGAHVVIAQADDCADALRLARRRLNRQLGSGQYRLVLVVLGDSVPTLRVQSSEVAGAVSGVRRNLLSRWLTLRRHRRSPVLISRPSALRDHLQWLDPASPH